MRLSQLFTKTSKTVPANESAKNAQLLIQAGYIHKEMAGVYAYLPLGKKVLHNISRIVREEMDSIGGNEVWMTVLQPSEIWQKTDRWDDKKVDNWFKTKLANGTELGVGLTHEEPITDMLRDFVSSYRELPVYIYQIGTKFRNELRAKSGLMRGREFLMKDLYSFNRNETEFKEFYEQCANAYTKIYQRLGLGEQTVRVRASGGIFSKYSDEYQTFSDIGEDLIFQTSDGTYYNREIAASKIPQPNIQEDPKPYEEVEGQGVIGVQALLKHLDIPIEKSTKTLIYAMDADEIIVACVRSDYAINELKLADVCGSKSLRLATDAEVKRVTGADIGYAGIVNLPDTVRVFLDDSLEGLCNFETGANKTNYHAINVNFERDLTQPDTFYDIKIAKAGDLDPATGQPMKASKAVEVGNIFPLSTKFSDALGLYYTDENGQQQSVVMGSYGIGISRLMGLLAEHFADDKGLVWPASVAPARVYLARLGDSEAVVKQADELYEKLMKEGIETLYDDRDLRPGEKFGDADLLGIPFRVVISDKTVESGTYELKKRTENDSRQVGLEELVKTCYNGQANN